MTAEALPAWVQYLSALSTPAIAVGGASIAFAQMRIARRKLKLDLFERRMKVYDDIHGAIVAAVGDATAREPVQLGMSARRNSEFLFSHEVHQAIDDTFKLILGLRATQYQLKGQMDQQRGGTPEFTALAKKEAETFIVLNNRRETLHELMKPYLSFPASE